MLAVKRTQGFSLIELLVAFSMTAMALTMMFQILGRGTSSLQLGQDYERAISIAQSRLAELTVNQQSTALTGVEMNKYHWRIRLNQGLLPKQIQANNAFPLQVIEVDVAWQSKNKQKIITLQSVQPVYFQQ